MGFNKRKMESERAAVTAKEADGRRTLGPLCIVWGRIFAAERAVKITWGILIVWIVAASGAGAQTLQQQAMCAAQAQKMYQADRANVAMGTNLLGYEDHYNQKMDRCFMLETQMTKGASAPIFSTILMDAFEGHILALYVTDNARYRQCELTPGHETTGCKSAAEFNAFVEKYMGNVFAGVDP